MRRFDREFLAPAISSWPTSQPAKSSGWTASDVRGLGVARRVEAQAFYRSEGYRDVAAFSAEPHAHHWFEKEIRVG
ncbi:hypothetical protein QTA58_17180 [Neorhizobium sp. CSC1952]|uniref:hypothetical protein n=1 Tax=Neorhizobium sp. CSC1952 TaxID=2978974 RepID=UPI0025A509B0|nr:hypothetical protein [Rhizobium sp. CSC1952]WJR65949.1 hypothetical protein QTA58_17180 [Rhizobium sp. CSC1952]